MLADNKGRIVGKFKSPSPLLREQIGIVKNFLISIQKGRIEEMSKNTTSEKPKTERTNMVFLAGLLKFDPKVYDTQVRVLIDVGQKSCIQVNIYTGDKAPEGNKELSSKLRRFKEGDFVKLVAMLRPYGVKQDDDTWKNNLSVEITEIKNEPPQRQRQSRADDDIPY